MITNINKESCTGCGICIDLCNMDVLRLNSSDGKAHIAYLEDCMTCFECALNCPEGAIEVNFIPEFTPASIIFHKGANDNA